MVRIALSGSALRAQGAPLSVEVDFPALSFDTEVMRKFALVALCAPVMAEEFANN